MLIVFSMVTFSKKKGWVSTDAWRGYDQPIYAVAGASDTGSWDDSPAPSSLSKKEIGDIRRFLKSKGIHTQEVHGGSSNVFMGKRWVIVPPAEYEKAKRLADNYLAEHDRDTRLLHDANNLKDNKKHKLKDVS